MPLRAGWGKGPLQVPETWTVLTDTGERQCGLERDTNSCPTCYKPVKAKKETTVVGSHAPAPPPPSASITFWATSCKKHLSEKRPGQAGGVFSVQYLRVLSISRVPLHFQNFSQESDKRKKKGIVFLPSSCPSTPPVL